MWLAVIQLALLWIGGNTQSIDGLLSLDILGRSSVNGITTHFEDKNVKFYQEHYIDGPQLSDTAVNDGICNIFTDSTNDFAKTSDATFYNNIIEISIIIGIMIVTYYLCIIGDKYCTLKFACIILLFGHTHAENIMQKITAADMGSSDYFGGHSVSVWNDIAVIGAYADDDKGGDAGAAYIFERYGEEWIQTEKLVASDGAASDHFGISVAVYDDIVVVGARLDDNQKGGDCGSVYIYERTHSVSQSIWVETKLVPSDGAASDRFGRSVSIHKNFVVIGSPYDDDGTTNTGSAYVYEKTGGSWVFRSKLRASDRAASDYFGYSVSIYENVIAIGAYTEDYMGGDSGSVYVFEKTGANWPLSMSQTAKLTALDGASGDHFGWSVSVYNNTVLVGSHNHDISNKGDSGAAYIFEKVQGSWTQTNKLFALDGSSSDYFGISVSLFENIALIGAYADDDMGGDSGSVYIFEKINGNWIETEKLVAYDGASSDYFGNSVSIHGNHILVGSHGDDDPQVGGNTGAAYVIENRVSCDDIWNGMTDKSNLVGTQNDYLIDYKWTPCLFTNYPTKIPTNIPSGVPTYAPTDQTSNPSFHPSPVPTDSPSEKPTTTPTIHVSTNPTGTPTPAPSFSPLVATETCESQPGFIYHHNWDDTGVDNVPYFDYNIEMDENDLSLSIHLNLQYIGASTAKYVYGYGTIYVLDFEPFDGRASNHINHPGSCSNRLADSYDNVPWADYWKYSETPYINGHINSDSYLAYPPSGEYWTLSSNDGNPWIKCSRIKYDGYFTYKTLRGCTDYNGEELINIEETLSSIELSGRFYLSMVSPKKSDSESGFYYVKQLIKSEPFHMIVSKSTHVINSAGMDVCLVSLLGADRVYLSETNTDSRYEIFIATYSVSYMKLTNPQLLNAGNHAFSWIISEIKNDPNQDCIYKADGICNQFWEIKTNILPCPLSIQNQMFKFDFTAACNNDTIDEQSQCNGSVVMDFSFTDIDERNCNETGSIFTRVQFSAEMNLYSDEEFSIVLESNDKYLSGIDTIYGLINVDIPDNAHSVFEATLTSIWICTVDPTKEDLFQIDQSNPLASGCFDTAIVDAASIRNVMINGQSQGSYYNAIINDNTPSNIIKYSFLSPANIAEGRDKIFLHTQVIVSLIDDTRRRRILLQTDNNYNNVQQFLFGATSVNIYNDNAFATTKNMKDESISNESNDMTEIIIITLASIIAIFCIISIGIFIKKIHSKIKKKTKLYVTAV